MTDIKRILVPVDGSETSDRAIEEAIKIAEVYNSDIHILYVANINQLAINACLSDAILEAVTKAGNEILEKLLIKFLKNQCNYNFRNWFSICYYHRFC